MAWDIAHRRYLFRTLAFMAGYVAINMAAIRGAFDDRSAPGSYALGLAVAAPVAGQIWATLALMRDADEFVRAVTAKRFIIASGLTMAVASAWGFLELYAHATHISAAMVYPLFWGIYGLVTPFVRTARV